MQCQWTLYSFPENSQLYTHFKIREWQSNNGTGYNCIPLGGAWRLEVGVVILRRIVSSNIRLKQNQRLNIENIVMMQ
jgi:hypothetical protein